MFMYIIGLVISFILIFILLINFDEDIELDCIEDIFLCATISLFGSLLWFIVLPLVILVVISLLLNKVIHIFIDKGE